jgi:hypothetical protein
MRRASHNTAATASVVERETAESYVIGVPDAAAGTRLSLQLFGFHLLMMVLFMTVLLTIPAFVAAAANIMFSPKMVLRRLELDARGIELSRVYSRVDSGPSLLLDGGGSGPWVFGLGRGRVPAVRFGYDELRDVAIEGEKLVFTLHDGPSEAVDVSALDTRGRSALLERVARARETAVAGLLRSEIEDDRDLAALQALTLGREREGR